MSKSTFLPFITKTSSEETIFKAILQRTKGSTNSAISNLFSVVLMDGIENVRSKMDDMQGSMTTSAKIKDVVSQSTEHHIPQSERTFWSYVLLNLPRDTSNFSINDQKIMFAVLAVYKPEQLSYNGYVLSPELLKKCKEYSGELLDIGINAVPGIKITEKAEERVGFTSWEEFKAFLAVNYYNEDTKNLSPAFIDSDEEVPSQIYSENHSTSPYTGADDET